MEPHIAESVDEKLCNLESVVEWLHDIHVSLRHLAELKAGRKLDGYWEDEEL